MVNLPATPAAASPVLNASVPLSPLLEVPDLKKSEPLEPVLPAFTLCTAKLPLLDMLPEPV